MTNAMTAKATEFESFNFKNEELNEISEKIRAHEYAVWETGKINGIEIAKLVNHIDAHKLYEEDGFKTTTDFVMKTFGWQKSNARNYINVGHALAAGLLPEGNFTVSMYAEFASLPAETLKKAKEDGTFTDDMTQKELREKVSELKTKKEVVRKEPQTFWYYDGKHDIANTTLAKLSEMVNIFGEEFAKVKLGDKDLYVWHTDYGYNVIEKGDKVTETTLNEYIKAKKEFELELNELDKAAAEQE